LYIDGAFENSVNASNGTSTFINVTGMLQGSHNYNIDCTDDAGTTNSTGQINFEYLKPDTSEKFYFNQVGNQFGKTEVNIYSAHKLNKKWSTMIFAHGEYLANKVDKNKDN